MKKTFALLLVMLLLICGCTREKVSEGFQAFFFDVGKADAILVQSENVNILIDTGTVQSASSLVTELRNNGVKKIDILIITHFDKDHVGGAYDIISYFDIGTVYQSNSPKDSDQYFQYLVALSNKKITPVTVNQDITEGIDGLEIVINGPAENQYSSNPSNNSSLITMISYGDCSLLLMGDAEKQRLEEFIGLDYTLNSNVILKVPHHGNYHKQIKTLIEQYQPKAAVITCSNEEPEAKELEKTMNAFSEDTEVFLTRDGTVTLKVDSQGYSIKQ